MKALEDFKQGVAMDKFRFYIDFYKNCVKDRFEEHKSRTKKHGLGDLAVLQARDHEIPIRV